MVLGHLYGATCTAGQHRSIYLSMERWAMMTGVKCLYWTELMEFLKIFVKNTKAIIQWDRLFIDGRWAIMTSDVQNGIRVGLQPITIRVFTSKLSARMWFWKLIQPSFLLFCIPKSLQNVPKSPQKLSKSCIWDIPLLSLAKQLFFTAPSPNLGQIPYNLSTRIRILVLCYGCGNWPSSEFESQTPLPGYYSDAKSNLVHITSNGQFRVP